LGLKFVLTIKIAMEVKLIAFESFGVRSQATLVYTGDVKIAIDPAVSLAPRRFGLPPHAKEVERMLELAKEIEREAIEADIIVVTHYHYDHHDPGKFVNNNIYKDKTLVIKNPEVNINPNQKYRRAPFFLKIIKDKPNKIIYGDGKVIKLGNTEISFSNALPHGADKKLGYVMPVFIKAKGESFLFTSDVEGIPLDEHLHYVKKMKPDFIVLDGPLTYLLGSALSDEEFLKSINNIKEVIRGGIRTMIIDHHVMRDPNYDERISQLRDEAERFKVELFNAAQYMRKPFEPLEMRRKELYKEDPRRGDIINIKR
jgi:Predicted hydrolase (metallo-beta-lactamase superfamily)